jgi:hypothetical protein
MPIIHLKDEPRPITIAPKPKPFGGWRYVDLDPKPIKPEPNTHRQKARERCARHGYDPHCGDLAFFVLLAEGTGATHELIEDLAQHIQEAIEDWLTVEKERIEAAIAANHKGG